MQTSWTAFGGLLVAASLAAASQPVRIAAPNGPLPPLPASAGHAQDDATEPDGKALFLANCARCHGENGDGQGVTELDRPARSFQDGGFSYGNTVDAIVRTITNGIPGTPMPAFDSSSTADERRAMAEYVISLGPPGVVVDPASTELVVHDRPLVVRGLLPPIADGADAQPRGLLLGTADGLTFQYSADDVRLLGVRAGRFVERRDWTGRGGDALLPLGQLVYLVEDGDPRAQFRYRPEATGGGANAERKEALGTRLRKTWREHDRVGLEVELDAAGAPIAALRESVGAVGTSVAGGFRRSFSLAAGESAAPRPAAHISIALGALAPEDEVLARAGSRSDHPTALVVRRASGVVETYLVSLDPRPAGDDGLQAFLELQPVSDGSTLLDATWVPAEGRTLSVTTLSGTTFDDGHLQTIRAELNR